MMKLDDIHVGAPGAPEVSLSGATAGFVGDTLTFAASCSDTAATINWLVSGTTPSATTGNSITAVWPSAGSYTVQAYASNAFGTDTATLTVSIISCDTVTVLPWVESFENGQGCWQFVDNDNNDNNWEVVESYPHTGTHALLGVYTSTQEDNWAISQPITIPTDATGLSLSWYAMAYSASYPETYEVLISTTGASSLTDFDSVYGETIALTEYTKRSVSLASYAGQTIHVAFRHRSTDMFYFLIDDVRIGGLQVPENVTISGPIEARTGEDATFVASSSDATATYAWTFQGATPSTASGDTVTVSWATAGTYTIVLTATNGAGSASDTTTVDVIDCSTITTLPYATDFSTAATMGCWNAVDANNDGSTWYIYPGLGVVNWSVNNQTGDSISQNDYLVSPAIALPSGNIELKWSCNLGNASYPGDKYSVYVSTTGSNVSDFTTELFTETLTTGDEVDHIVDLSSYAGQTVYIAFRHYDCNALALVVSNIEVRLQAAPEVTIIAPTTAMTGVEVTLSADCDNATSYSWTIEGATPSTATTASVNAVWDNAGTYNISLTATNAAGSSTANATIEVIQCDPITEFPFQMGFEPSESLGCWTFIDADGDGFNWNANNFNESGMGHGGSNYVMASASYDNPTYSPLTPDNWMFTPALVIPEGSNFTLTWYEKGQDASYAAEHYAVYIASSPVVDNSLTAAYEGDATPNWVRRTVDLSNYAGQTIFVAFRHYNVTDMFLLDIDDIRVGAPEAGIDEVADAQVTLYPNPTTGMLYISAENVKSVTVVDVNGRTVMTQLSGAAIDMSNLANGTYFVRTVTEKGVSVERVVKR